jgi:hypothetical protein
MNLEGLLIAAVGGEELEGWSWDDLYRVVRMGAMGSFRIFRSPNAVGLVVATALCLVSAIGGVSSGIMRNNCVRFARSTMKSYRSMVNFLSTCCSLRLVPEMHESV